MFPQRNLDNLRMQIQKRCLGNKVCQSFLQHKNFLVDTAHKKLTALTRKYHSHICHMKLPQQERNTLHHRVVDQIWEIHNKAGRRNQKDIASMQLHLLLSMFQTCTEYSFAADQLRKNQRHSPAVVEMTHNIYLEGKENKNSSFLMNRIPSHN